ncbi:hypothetical protein Cni_G15534 [Canna indica]|uniref:VQ domain-containing protein n=1 Tax=Canna indica TaxID=4628 RepID=A0AAQ3KGA0_9LILI|nr:hypothetical protein Cni_G15534 [Canna indica]
MNMAENCSVLDPWVYRSAESAWISEAFSRDNEVLTRALQISLSDTSSSGGGATPTTTSPDALSAATSSSPFLLHHHQLTPAAALRPRNPLAPPSAGRVSKRKSRASKRSPTTYINADPANFREMVQRVTGVQLSGEPGEPLVKPEPLRPAAARAALQQVCLPTLDTSAFFLDRGPARPSTEAGSVRLPAEHEPIFDFDALAPAFPTLESWSVM